MEEYRFDTIVLGGGLAGLRAAVEAASCGPKHRVALLTAANESSYGGCSWKTHGTNAAMNPTDSPAQHAADTFAGGGKVGNRQLATILAQRIPNEIRRMELRGVGFDKAPDGDYATGYYGGSTQSRSIHSKDMAGKRMVDALMEEMRTRNVFIFNERRVVQLALSEAGCVGAYAFNARTNQTELFLSTATISALGGGACVYPISTIAADKVATGFAQAYEANGSLIDMEMVQFHPTGLNRPGSAGHGEIMEEELRSMGAIFLNGQGERFMFRYDPRGERATRDIVARGAYSEMMRGAATETGGIIFDLSSIDRSVLAERFPFMTQRLRSFGVDVLNHDKVEISPAAHFVMGGLEIGEDASTSIPRLFACGEDAGGIHGGNRLGGNGVADALVFGAVAGQQAASVAPTGHRPSPTTEVTLTSSWDESELNYYTRRISDVMWENVGPVRNDAGLRKAEKILTSLWHSPILSPTTQPVRSFNATFERSRVAYQKALFAMMVVKSALARGNSVGAHYRTDSDGDNAIYNVLLRRGPDGLPEVSRRMGVGTMEGALSPEMAA